MNLHFQNVRLKYKLLLVALLMFGFGYALVPLYDAFCAITGINVLALRDKKLADADAALPRNTQVDTGRWITVEFDANARGPWDFKPARSHMQVHPGEIATVMYEFQNVQRTSITAQAIPSYAPLQAAAHFHKIECFCFRQYTLAPGEKKLWPVTFVIDPELSKDVSTITLSYTFFEVGGKTPAAPTTQVGATTTSGVTS